MFFSRLTTFQSLFILIGVSVAIKVMTALMLPIVGDEAYFIVWGNYPDYGYYDHPPMVGWWLTALLQFSDHPLWLRLPTILTTTLIGAVIFYIMRPYGKTNALIASGLYWLAPVNLVAPLITTDTPVIFWCFLSGISFYKAQRHDRYGWYLLAGVFLGLGFFSKFFAGLLGLAYFFYLVFFVRRGLRPWLGLLLVIIGTLPFIGLNLLWNYNNCWDNYLFNLQNRTSDYAFSIWSVIKYLLLLLYLVTPPIVYYVLRRPGKLVEVLQNGGFGLFLALFLIPVALFLPLSTGKSIGLHWLLSFYPFLFISLPLLLHFGQLRVCFYFMWGFGLLHVLTLVIVIFMLPGIFRDDEKLYKELVYGMYTNELLKQVRASGRDLILATPSYSQSAILSYYSKQHVIVFGHGSYHGRQDDIITDFRALDKKDIAILSFNQDVKQYVRYFESFEYRDISLKDTHYHLGIGSRFKYEEYDRKILSEIRKQFYNIPAWLPTGECYMYSRE